MMRYLEYVFKIMVYVCFALAVYFAAEHANRGKRVRICLGNKCINRDNGNIGLLAIFVLAVFLGVYSLICDQSIFPGDRRNYARGFENDGYLDWVKSESLGLYWIMLFLHKFTHDSDVLFFSVAALSGILTLVGYNGFEDKLPKALLYLGFSLYFVYSLFLLKQIVAVAISTISIAAFLRKKRVLSVIMAILACAFHETALLLIPLLIACAGAQKTIIRIMEYIFLAGILLFFNIIVPNLASFAIRLFPFLEEQLRSYTVFRQETTGAIDVITIIKGLPIYVITVVGICKRSSCLMHIKHYDIYLTMAVFASCTTLMSAYMYWSWRFALYCYLPIFIFWTNICKYSTESKSVRLLDKVIVFLLFALLIKELAQFYFLYGGIG